MALLLSDLEALWEERNIPPDEPLLVPAVEYVLLCGMTELPKSGLEIRMEDDGLFLIWRIVPDSL